MHTCFGNLIPSTPSSLASEKKKRQIRFPGIWGHPLYVKDRFDQKQLCLWSKRRAEDTHHSKSIFQTCWGIRT